MNTKPSCIVDKDALVLRPEQHMSRVTKPFLCPLRSRTLRYQFTVTPVQRIVEVQFDCPGCFHLIEEAKMFGNDAGGIWWELTPLLHRSLIEIQSSYLNTSTELETRQR
jgi:hypothetical protein